MSQRKKSCGIFTSVKNFSAGICRAGRAWCRAGVKDHWQSMLVFGIGPVVWASSLSSYLQVRSHFYLVEHAAPRHCMTLLIKSYDGPGSLKRFRASALLARENMPENGAGQSHAIQVVSSAAGDDADGCVVVGWWCWSCGWWWCWWPPWNSQTKAQLETVWIYARTYTGYWLAPS